MIHNYFSSLILMISEFNSLFNSWKWKYEKSAIASTARLSFGKCIALKCIGANKLLFITQRSCTITPIVTDFYKEILCNKTQRMIDNIIMQQAAIQRSHRNGIFLRQKEIIIKSVDLVHFAKTNNNIFCILLASK